MKVFISWSGGKETSLACHKVTKKGNIKVAYLLNMISEDGKYSRSHGVRKELMQAQSDAIGIPIVQTKTTWQTYEAGFKKVVLNFKKEGITAGVFGDIDLQEHRDWVERVCGELSIKPLLPLWKEDREKLLKEFIAVGFKAIVVATNANFLDHRWLGREINNEFIKELKLQTNIDLCGEKGEYHTFVYDGPIFKEQLKFLVGNKIKKDKKWFLEITHLE